ncbi:PRC-barrel domain-containing protein [Pelagibacterium luteolum]|uniref:PRC-barrel domain-containing protein n=1 Tax=Pelagibacterium luteolum TaxID=440168 RepID=A0A1G7ULZ1_9HYPH|nr:PRC-barrel domain-containing protein [Pelagibacterium luteolum]SDG48251.1 PRC-barrel domain-containing protein [Pelagibacterium luteolum]
MYRKLLATTALSLVLAGGAYAQDMAPADPAMAPADPAMEAPVETPEVPLVSAEETGINADGWLATEILGETIYNSTGDDAEAIGDVNDFVLDQNGEIGAVVVGVGGFLGIGQKNVAINWEDLELATDADGNNRLVAGMTREQLENAAEFNREEWLQSEANAAAEMDAMAPAGGDAMAPAAPAPVTNDAMAPADDTVEPADDAVVPADDAMAPAGDDAAAVPADDAMATDEPMADDAAVVTAPAWDSYETVAVADITADELTGTTVYGAGDEDIGSIGDILLSEDGSVDAVIIDFGGFLGIGTKEVAVGFDNLEFLRDEDGDLILRTSLSAEQLEAAPEYDEDAYTASPADNTYIVE